MRSSPSCHRAGLPLTRTTAGGGCLPGHTNTNPPGGTRAPPDSVRTRFPRARLSEYPRSP